MSLTKKNMQDKDITFPNPPSDGISSISVNGTTTTASTMLIAGSWDNNVYCYELQNQQGGGLSNIIRQGQMAHEAPVLCTDIGPDGMTTFSGGCDGQIRMWNPSQGPTSAQIIGKHDQPVRNMKYLPTHNVLVTSSWDKSIRIWDTRQPTAVATLNLPERIYAMDTKGDAIVAGTAGKQLVVYNVNNLGSPVSEFRSSLNFQTRSISIFHDTQGFAMGCIEGRVAVEYFSEMQNKVKQQQTNGTKVASKNFVFKCHRDGSNVHSVNSIDFHNYGTFCTAGSDGTFCWWDKEARHRLAVFEAHKGRCPITMVKFNPMGNMMFYAMSYDWCKGAEHNDPKHMWVLWEHKSVNKDEEWGNSMREVGEFSTIEEFMVYWRFMPRPSEVLFDGSPRKEVEGRSIEAFSVFKKGIRPEWEDPSNKMGSELTCRKLTHPEQLDVFWENLVLALIGETIDEGDEICGCRVVDRSARKGVPRTMYKLEVWLRSDNAVTAEKLKVRVLDALSDGEASKENSRSKMPEFDFKKREK